MVSEPCTQERPVIHPLFADPQREVSPFSKGSKYLSELHNPANYIISRRKKLPVKSLNRDV